MAGKLKMGGVALLLLIITAESVLSSGSFIVTHAPKYTGFFDDPGVTPLKTNEISAVILATLGLPLSQDIEWNGLTEGNLFRRPKASVTLSVSTSQPISVKHFEHKYDTVETDGMLDTEIIINNIMKEDWKNTPINVNFYIDSTVLTMQTSASELFTQLPSTIFAIQDNFVTGWFTADRLGSLNISNDVDLLFISELYSIEKIINKINDNKELITKSGSPDFYHFSISGLRQLQDIYGVSSTQSNDAQKLLSDFIVKITNEFDQIYSGNVVVQIVTFTSRPDAALGRKTRSLLESYPSANKTQFNLAPEFSDMYAAMFNIILWTMIGFALAVFGISWGMWQMDPGRDSLIYRMTSQRMKRD